MHTSTAEQPNFSFEVKHYLTWSFFSFPGGKKDPEDESVIETAVREMEEEMGLEKSRVQVWAQMPAMPDRVIVTSVFKVNGLNPVISKYPNMYLSFKSLVLNKLSIK